MNIPDLRSCTLLLAAFPIGHGSGAGMQIDLRILGAGENLTIEHCLKDSCKPARVPESLKDRLAEGDSLSIEDINGNGMSEVVATSAHDVKHVINLLQVQSDREQTRAIRSRCASDL